VSSAPTAGVPEEPDRERDSHQSHVRC
jgi:hypothetical protein